MVELLKWKQVVESKDLIKFAGSFQVITYKTIMCYILGNGGKSLYSIRIIYNNQIYQNQSKYTSE